MSANEAIFEHHLAYDPGADQRQFLGSVPARWVVYLMADESDRPVQLLCVKNLRASLARRLAEPEAQVGPTRKVDLRQIVRRVHWTQVHSALEADWVYLQAARRLFPQSYAGLLGAHAAWFVHVDPDAEFPRYTKTTVSKTPSPARTYFGPLEDKHAAQRLIELLEDAFDLCRYYSILVQAPRANACAYKSMHKCPAPCDGSISMPQYRRMMQWSTQVLVDPAPMIQQQTQRMQQAAGELRFEVAGKIKQFVEQLSRLGTGDFRHVRRLDELVFLSMQRGPVKDTAKLLLVTPAGIQMLGVMLDTGADLGQWTDYLKRLMDQCVVTLDAHSGEHLALISRHLFARRSEGVFFAKEQLTAEAMATAFRQLQRRGVEPESPEEGLLREGEALEGSPPPDPAGF